MSKKHVVQMPVDDETYSKVRFCAKYYKTSQAKMMRSAFEDFYRRMIEREMDRKYQEGYAKHPEDSSAADIQLSVLSEVLEEEDW